MRATQTSGGVTARAVAGNHAVFLGFNLDAGARAGCLGFAVYRVDHTESEQYWLAGFKTFRSVVPVPDPNTVYSTLDHPLQTFYWGDYTAKPAHEYSYRIVPRYGAPKNLADRDGAEVTLDVGTSDPTDGTHGVYFNRGVAASQAYTRKFGLPPDQLQPEKQAEALAWLSRGLMEAILGVIGEASSADFAIRAAVYEFTQPDVLAAFRAAHERGADVKIVYHALDDGAGNANRQAIAAAGLDPTMLIERKNAKIAHNKFIVLCTKDAAGELAPISVWTGSTNLSEGGIYGHSNVGHAVRDTAVAERFLQLWSTLEPDPLTPPLQDWITTNSAFDAGTAGAAGTQTIFSPRHGLDPLNWYAHEFGGPQASVYITEAFGMNTAFENALEAYTGDALHYVLLEKPDDHQAQWATSPKVIVAVGSAGGPAELSRWAQERLTGFNPRVQYLHTKILLVDPVSAAPTVISGSANFSSASTTANDENMLVIAADADVADVYFTEFMRMFNHFYARWWASQLGGGAATADAHSFLDETDAWQTPYFTDGHPKQRQRTLYSS